jgi:hypothetical protein
MDNVQYSVMQTRCQETIAKETAIQQPLPSDGFTNRHVSTATIAQQ